MIRTASLVLVAAATLAGTASAQTAPRSSTSKFFIGAALGGSSIKFDEDGSEAESGGHLSVQLGYGFTPKLAMFIEGTGASIKPDGADNSVALGHFDLGARYHFANPARAFVPYLELALSGRALVENDAQVDDGAGGTTTADVSFSGAGFTIGGGVLYFFNPKWAFNGGLKWTTGEFTTIKVDNVSMTGLDADATTARLNLGLTWFPKGG